MTGDDYPECEERCPTCGEGMEIYARPGSYWMPVARHEPGGRDCAVFQLSTALVKLKELRATIDKLPQDSEGKPVVFNQTVWIVCDGSQNWLDPGQYVDEGIYEAKVNCFVGDLDHMWGLFLEGADDVDWWDGPVHSTKEAAEAVKEKME